MRHFLILGILLLVTITLKAQYYETGVEPFSVKWRQMSEGKIRLIYPSNAESFASKYLTMLVLADSLVGNDYHIKKTKIDVILHNHSALSNGFVAWAPRRMELVTQPGSDGFAQPWHYQLAVHEMRHVKQMYALQRNVVKTATFPFGQQATGLAAGFAPLWFLEGDAVATETAYSYSGRGRSASFYQHYRTHFLSNASHYSYDKWLNGSYKNFIPNHYNLGYQVVAYGNIKYGYDIWANTLDYITRRPYTLFPFYFGLKHETGLSRKGITEKMFAYQDSAWSKNLGNISYSSAKQVSNNYSEYKNYLYPFQVNDSILVAYKTSLTDIPSFVSININTQKETLLVHPGYLLGKPSYAGNLILWAEYKPHPRWEYSNSARIVVFNLATKSKKVYSTKGMLRSPVLNQSSGKIFCIGQTPQGTFYLGAINKNGTVAEQFLFPEGIEPFELTHEPETNLFYIGATTPAGKQIMALNSGYSLETVVEPTYNNINSIYATNDSIFFAASYNNIENIFLYNVKDSSTYQVINSKYGSNYPYLTATGTFIFSNYTPQGYQLSIADSINAISLVNTNNPIDDSFTRALAKNALLNIDTLEIKNTAYPSKPYRGAGSVFNLHSWAPFYFNPYNSDTEESPVGFGVTAMSQNLTGNTVMILGYGYGDSHLFRANIKYSGLWPVFSFSFELYDDYAYLFSVNNLYYQPNVRRTRLKLYAYLPITLSSNYIFTYFQPFTKIERTNDYLYSSSVSAYRSGLITLDNGIYFQATRKMSHRDLLPRLGTAFTFNWVSAPYNRNNIGSLYALNAEFYLPGFLSNHHIKLTGALQKQLLENYYLSNKVDAPRGYDLYLSEKFKGFSVDYLFPLAYPDLAVGSLIYIKRFSVDMFFDYAKNSFPARTNNLLFIRNETQRSFGFEMDVDFHVLRTRYPFRLKYQQAFTGNNNDPYSSFSLTVNIYGNTVGNYRHAER